ncbi:phage tail sheath family protein [Thalassomonas actiniarum]|uniref:Phage tail sheath subtilisin-like domain-containing protein n=1 Tax=Thalassomonas actiniarum TaxID=485447 RepID=A0AAE9YHV4_9GAMM|nr:phage tail sheath C-terminal domain-containing protein [Thalassomonas actiniarum]WDD96725.1 phage tail sheath subtilisin-like domain-containing protein [Thalassomonas actiniarum]
MASYKTPDVYVEEISIFPPSVAQVETAIPAFIGYTQKAKRNTERDLLLKPTEVTSLPEYNLLFGEAPPINVDNVNLDENFAVADSQMTSKFYMYDAIRLFFKNGGGKCYIVSVGVFEENSDGPVRTDFDSGLAALKKQDEPTMILFPDAVNLDAGNFYGLQKQALVQCKDLQDRVCIFDLQEEIEPADTYDWKGLVYEAFRNNIGMNNLKYGAAYTPWLKTNLPISVHYRDIRGKVKRAGIELSMKGLVPDPQVDATVDSLDQAVDDKDTVDSGLETLRGDQATINKKFTKLLDEFKKSSTANNYKALYNFIYDIALQVNNWYVGGAALKNPLMVTQISSLVKDSLKGSLTKLISYDIAADAALTSSYKLHDVAKYTDFMDTDDWGKIFKTTPPAAADAAKLFGDGNNTAKQLNSLSKIIEVFAEVIVPITEILSAAKKHETTQEDTLYDSHPIYKNIVRAIGASLTTIPPSGAMAGIYAMVDSTRGVWKAPANVSVNGVVGLNRQIDFFDQETLNVDVNSGKSINCIRAFTGRGMMVWGARTLAGNDNEWRYISVRRFFNMVEESVKKSTYWAVFEPNDANTWIKVKAMIENFLTLQWRDGALQGATTKQAFFVNVGLGTTMTAMDILEGRMIVEIGMAVVRPAEFIILRFSHKMPEA